MNIQMKDVILAICILVVLIVAIFNGRYIVANLELISTNVDVIAENQRLATENRELIVKLIDLEETRAILQYH